MTNHILKLVRKFKELLLQEFGSRVHKVLLFGSYASGTYGSASDIDVAVVLEGPVHW
jgi:predicted nucleotidyltransferase